MINPKLIRKEFEFVKKNLERRRDQKTIQILTDWYAQDKELLPLQQEIDFLRSKINKINQQIIVEKLSEKDIKPLVAEAKITAQVIKEKEVRLSALKITHRDLLMRIPNLLDESVPVGNDGSENQVIKRVGSIIEPDFEPKHHGQLATELGVTDFERAVNLSGAGFYILKGDLALLNLAIVNYAVNKLAKKGFTFVITPGMIKRKPYEGVINLADFQDMLYKVEKEDYYLIATAEHPLIAMHIGETFDSKDLPIKYMGYTTNYRKEIGAHGLDERGLFRLHQFDKVEQTIICEPEESKKWHEELLKNAEEIVNDFEIPYQVISICDGDIGLVAAKKYDIEAWSPREKKYFETHSLSNCTTYQSLRLNIKYKNSKIKDYVHTLNATAVAVPRMLRAIIENYQTKDGTIKIPKVLQPNMGGKKEIMKSRPERIN
ncbi:MAG: serine--tRNA ligase [Candidatus Diapherotrites archaeon]|nr:serine--tRNA ligase [Candidatus Diapherotrites archaeon]